MERYKSALEAIVGMKINESTDHAQLTALMIAIAKSALETRHIEGCNSRHCFRCEQFGDPLRTGTGSLRIKEIKGGELAVVRYLPAGMDIGPHVYGRYNDLDAANHCFEIVRPRIQKMFAF